jgi:sensor histidine kinase YesM
LALLENADTTQEIVFSFSELLRYTLKKNSTHLVCFKEEIEYIQNYLKIQSIRLGNRLQYNIEVEEKLMDVMTPFMMLQPIVENAINHGIEKKRDGGTIEVVGYKENKKMIIKIKDNGVGLSKEKIDNIFNINKNNEKDKSSTGLGIGLNNLNRRLEYYYNGKHSMDIYSNEGEGTTIKIEIPIKKECE